MTRDGNQAPIEQLATEYIKEFGLGHHFATRVLMHKPMPLYWEAFDEYFEYQFDPRYDAKHDDLKRYVNDREME